MSVTEPTWTAEELAELTRIEPLSGAEVIALGLTGGWSDMGIEDPVEWLAKQRRKNYTWHFKPLIGALAVTLY